MAMVVNYTKPGKNNITETHRVTFNYRRINGHPSDTTCLFQQRIGDRPVNGKKAEWKTWALGYSVCSKQDQFDRYSGRLVSLQRAYLNIINPSKRIIGRQLIDAYNNRKNTSGS